MVLDKLGSALKSGINKISNAIFLDKKLIDGIIKDIQKSLIEADVNIELVFALSQKIKKLAYDETIKGIDKKEQLVKQESKMKHWKYAIASMTEDEIENPEILGKK